MFKCNECGAIYTSMKSDAGRTAYCKQCGNVMVHSADSAEYGDDAAQCEDCGLTCPASIERCPACGGKVVVGKGGEKADKGEASSTGDLYLKKWESNMGGYSFSTILILSSTILLSSGYIYASFKIFDIPTWCASWWLCVFELVANATIGIVALILLGMFFRRSESFTKCIVVYFKVSGWALLVDLVCAMGVVALEYGGDVATIIDIKQFANAFWCFFWAWYFKRVYK